MSYLLWLWSLLCLATVFQENTHCSWKYHCMAGLQINRNWFDQTRKCVVIFMYLLKQLNPQQSNRTYAIQWYFLLRWVFSVLSYVFFGGIPKAGVESPRTLQTIIATYHKCTWVWFNLHPRWPTDLQVSQKRTVRQVWLLWNLSMQICKNLSICRTLPSSTCSAISHQFHYSKSR